MGVAGGRSQRRNTLQCDTLREIEFEANAASFIQGGDEADLQYSEIPRAALPFQADSTAVSTAD